MRFENRTACKWRCAHWAHFLFVYSIRAFGRAYRECMGREADSGGLKFWSKNLYEHTATGKSLVRYFVLSSEMKGKNLSNTEYIKVVYRVMLGREADNGGINYWRSQMENGKKIEDIINGFVDSNEFKGICSDYGIQRK